MPYSRCSFAEVTGNVVDATGNPIQGVRVTPRDVGSLGTVMSSDRTNDRGRFRLTGITSDELGLKFNGNPVGFETGHRRRLLETIEQLPPRKRSPRKPKN